MAQAGLLDVDVPDLDLVRAHAVVKVTPCDPPASVAVEGLAGWLVVGPLDVFLVPVFLAVGVLLSKLQLVEAVPSLCSQDIAAQQRPRYRGEIGSMFLGQAVFAG